MGYSTQIAISLLLFVAFSIPRNAFVQAGGPWADPGTAEIFMRSFVDGMKKSGVFSPDQLNDMNSISQTITSSMDRMFRQGKSSGHMLQALNMAFASSIAEIAISEGADLNTVTNAISNAVTGAFLQTTGFVDPYFVNEIKQLVSMFAKAQNEVGGYGGSAAVAGASVSTATGANGYAAGAGAGAAAAGSGTGAGYGAGARTGGTARYGSGVGAGAGASAVGAGGYGSGGAGRNGAGAGAGTGVGGAGRYGTDAGAGGAGVYDLGGYNQYSSSSTSSGVSSAAFSQSGYGVGSGGF